jgi:hypothetical protein
MTTKRLAVIILVFYCCAECRADHFQRHFKAIAVAITFTKPFNPFITFAEAN